MAAEVFATSPLNPFKKRGASFVEEMATSPPTPLHDPKRRRLKELNAPAFGQQHLLEAEERDPATRKRSRACGQVDENLDRPVYTQRNFNFLEQAKNQEMERMRQEFAAILEQKEAELQAKHQECEQLGNENRILKRAVQIQHGASEKLQHMQEQHKAEISAFVEAGSRATEYIRNLEQTNFALKAHLEQMAAPHMDTTYPRWGT